MKISTLGQRHCHRERVGTDGGYRAYRRSLTARERASRMTMGVDVDGVLADQIVGVLPRIRQEHGLCLTRAEITDWRLPIGSTDIARELERAQEDHDYVLKMPLHDGAKLLLKTLRKSRRVVVITARRAPAADWTAEWLRQNKLPHDELVAGGEAKKSLHGTDVLVDDYLGNLLEYLQRQTADQP